MTRRLSPDVLGDSCAFWFGDMHLPVDDSSGNGWRNSIDEATGVPNGVDVNGPLPSTYLDGSTPKAQPPESSWGQFNLAPADLDSSSNWSLRTGLTPTGTDSALWSNTSTATLPHQQQRSQQIKAAATQHLPRATAPMPIPERSSTEPLWRRRLNAKNYELQQLHSRMSAPDVNMSNKALSPPKSAQESPQPTVRQEPNHTWHSQSDMVVNDHDFTHASPNALRMLGIDPNSFQQTMPIANVQHSNGGMAAFESTGNGIATAGRNAVGNDNAFAAPMVMMETLNSDSLPPQHGYAPHSSSLPHYDSMAMLDYDARQSPRAFRRSMHDADLHMFGDSASSPATAMYVGTGYRTSSSNDFDLDGSSAYMASGFAPSSADLNAAQASSDDSTMHFSANGKGVINKVIVPSTNGAPSDAVDIRTGEAGQMRHVCPHPGCDKHFSTSGHARRHSRIHDCLRPFECPHQGCHATFTRRDNCTQHQRARHRFQLVAHRIGDEQ